MNDTTRIVLIREVLSTFTLNCEDEDGDRNLADRSLCIDALDAIVNVVDPDLEALEFDGWISPATTARFATGHCPEGCGCRLGTEDADARECGCDGLCTRSDAPALDDTERVTGGASRGIATDLASTAADIAADIRLMGQACPASLEHARGLLDILSRSRDGVA
jgi:hypothetical protein